MKLKEALLKFGRDPVLVDLSEIQPVMDELGLVIEPGEEVYARSLTGPQRHELAQAKDNSITDAEIALWGACTKDGQPYFTEEEVQAIDGRVTTVIARKVFQLSGLLPNSAKEAAKNSESNPS